jgi:hypothetical protein
MYFSYKKLKRARNRDDVILRICQGKRVLHVGSADSPYTQQKFDNGLLLHSRLGGVAEELVGVDLDAEAARWMNCRGLAETHVMDLDRAPSLGFSADVIIFGETIEHLVNVGLCLDSLKACMTESTRLIVSTPNCYHLWFTSMVLRNHETVHDDHKVGFTYGLLFQTLRHKGLMVEDFYFTFLPRERFTWWRRLWILASWLRPGISETLLAICTLKTTQGAESPATRGRAVGGIAGPLDRSGEIAAVIDA